jgi:septal ring factor EnvC (AmiA/AmiB activator)
VQARESFYTMGEFKAATEKLATRAELDALSARSDDRFDQVDKRFEQIDKRFEQVDKRFDQVDKRFDKVEGRLDRVETRLDGMTASLARLEERSRHGATRAWVLAGAVGALVGLLGWLSRSELLAAVQTAGL